MPNPTGKTAARARGSTTTRAPRSLLMLLEGRAPMEMLSLLAPLPWIAACRAATAIRSSSFPGWAQATYDLAPLRRSLQSLGYVTQAWGQGLNFGPRRGVIERAADDIRTLCRAASANR